MDGRLPSGFEMVSMLGSGSAGTVFLALDLTGRRVAVKILKAVWAAQPDLVARFQREARAMASLDDPHIVRVHGLLEAGDELALVMEYVDGGTLNSAVGQLSIAPAMTVIGQLQAAVSHAHLAGIVHRDLKPGNVLVDRAGTCKLTDFGVARFVSESLHAAGRDAGVRTATGTVLGTPTYLSPEAASATGVVDGRADLYSLAVVAYELLVGRPPFVGHDVYQLLVDHAQVPPPPPSLVVTGFPAGIESVLLRALEKRPEDRQADVARFWTELSSAADEEWPGWRERGDPSELASACPPPVTVAGTAKPALSSSVATLRAAELPVYRPPRRRRRRLLLTASGVLLCAAAGFLAVRGIDGPSTELAATGVAVTVTPPGGRADCSHPTLSLRAVITTNGRAGVLHFQWSRTSTGAGPIENSRVNGRGPAVATLNISYQGRGSAADIARLTVLGSGGVDSGAVPVWYSC